MIDVDKKLMAYFRELSPRDRRIMLEEIIEEGETPPEVCEFCEQIYRERYQDAKKSDQKVDNWLWKFVYLPGLYRKRGFFRGGMKREAPELLHDLHLEDADSLGEMESTILYFEYRNAAKRYLSTCNNPNYGKRFFGLKSIDDDEKRFRPVRRSGL